MSASPFKKLLSTWKSNICVFAEWNFLISFAFSILILFASLVVNYYAGMYSTTRASNYVTDIILSNIPVFDVEDIFVYGPLFLWGFVCAILIVHPHKIPFTLKAISLFIVVRSSFIILTHIGPFPTRTFIDPTNFLAMFTMGNDLFFSGHTGLPFLMALVFWDDLKLRIIFIASAILFGVVVLLGHIHYTIDVAAAFFITYTIYHIAEYGFKTDLKYFKKG